MPLQKAVVFQQFLSTPSARRATNANDSALLVRQISIHALREEGDSLLPFTAPPVSYFYPRPPRGGRRVAGLIDNDSHVISIHALREEGDIIPLSKLYGFLLFLSTPSARRATGAVQGRDLRPDISIHALREEGDAGWKSGMSYADLFLSTPSARRATLPVRVRGNGQEFLSTPSARRATTKTEKNISAFVSL